MRLVQEHDRVLGQIVCQCRRRITRRRARQVPAVVLDALAVPDFAEHLQVEAGALLQALRLDQLTVGHQLLEALGEFELDGLHRCEHLVARRHIVAAGVDRETQYLLLDAPGQWIEQLQRLDLVVEQLDPYRQLAVFGRKNVDRVAAHTELSARKIFFVALVLHAYQLGNHVALAHLVAAAQCHHHLVVGLGLADAVDRRHRGDDHNVAPLEHALGTRQAHLLDVLVDRRVFLDEQIALRHIGLGLVVVVVADEILDRIAREELAELAVQLGGQRLVGRKDDGRAPESGYDIGHREGLARTGDTEQGLEYLAVTDAFDQLVDRLGLVAGRRIWLEQFERRVRKIHELALGVRCCFGGSRFNDGQVVIGHGRHSVGPGAGLKLGAAG